APRTVPVRAGGERAFLVELVVRRRAQRRRADGGRRLADLDPRCAGGPAHHLRHAGRAAARGGCAALRAPPPRGPRAAVRPVVRELDREPLPGLPPLTGGLVGYLGYAAVRRMERLPVLAVDDPHLPQLGVVPGNRLG